MALTRSFKDLVESRVERDPAFGAALLREDIVLSGDVGGGNSAEQRTGQDPAGDALSGDLAGAVI